MLAFIHQCYSHAECSLQKTHQPRGSTPGFSVIEIHLMTDKHNEKKRKRMEKKMNQQKVMDERQVDNL